MLLLFGTLLFHDDDVSRRLYSWRDLMLLQRDGSERMAVCTVEARGGSGGVLEGHDRDVVGACWPAVLKAASAAFAAGVRDSVPIFSFKLVGPFFHAFLH